MGVLGLRRIKESWFTNYIANVGEFDKTSQSEMQNVYNQYGFEIEPTTITVNGITATLLGLTTTFAYIESEVLPNTISWVGKVNLNGAEMYTTTDADTFTDIIRQFTVTATPNSTVDEWLLANTEAVEDKEYLEKASWYKSVADAIRSKKGTTEPILRDDFPSAIEGIETGGGVTIEEYDGTVAFADNSIIGTWVFNNIINMPDVEHTSGDWEHTFSNLDFTFKKTSGIENGQRIRVTYTASSGARAVWMGATSLAIVYSSYTSPPTFSNGWNGAITFNSGTYDPLLKSWLEANATKVEEESIVGTWVFNDSLFIRTTGNFYFSFASNGVNYNHVRLEYNKSSTNETTTTHHYFRYGSSDSDRTLAYEYYKINDSLLRDEWKNNNFKTIQILSDIVADDNNTQEKVEAFKIWIIANAKREVSV